MSLPILLLFVVVVVVVIVLVVVAVVDIVVFVIIVTIVVVVVVVRTIYSDSLIHQSLKVNSKQIQKNLKLESDVYITDYRSLLK